MRFSTRDTPGAAHAATPASSFSAHDRTLPRRITWPSSICTLIRRASISAFRLSAASIYALTSAGETRGLSVMSFDSPLTPVK
jgi:hypothetical protein